MEVFITVDGQLAISFEDHIYTKFKTGSNAIVWECHRGPATCKGTLVTDVFMSKQQLLVPHNHASDFRSHVSFWLAVKNWLRQLRRSRISDA